MIELVTTSERDRAVWETIMNINDWFPAPWTLIGARMVQLHAMAAGRVVPRVSLDADALADVRALPGATQELSSALTRRGFELKEMSGLGVAHRFVRGDVSIDVLAPDGLNSARSRLTVGSLHTVEVPGGSQALQRTRPRDVRLGQRRGVVPVPDLLGAILLKSRAVGVDDAPENQRIDLALLLILVEDVGPLSTELRRTEKTWLRRRPEMAEPTAACWRFFSADEAQRGIATFRQLIS